MRTKDSTRTKHKQLWFPPRHLRKVTYFKQTSVTQTYLMKFLGHFCEHTHIHTPPVNREGAASMDAALINWARHREVGLETTWQFPTTPLSPSLTPSISLSLSLSGVKRVGRWAAGRSGGSSALIFHWRQACPSPYIAGAPSGNAWLGSRL